MKKILFLILILSNVFAYNHKWLMKQVITSDSYTEYKTNRTYHNLPLVSKFYIKEFLEDLSLNQQQTLIWAYKLGKQFGYEYSLSAIAWKESLAGKVDINLFDKPYGSCGIFHNNLKTVVNFMRANHEVFIINRFNLNKLCAELQHDPEYSMIEAVRVLRDAQRKYKNNWMKIWAHYNGGWAHPNKKYAKDIYYRIKALRFIFKTEKIDKGN